MYRFHIDIPDFLWLRFKEVAIEKHGSPRQAALFLFRQFINEPDSPRPKGEPHASDDNTPTE